MNSLLRRLVKIAAYTAAGAVILLAIAVGLFRLFLPRLPEYQDEIKGWASTAVGLQVDFTGMDARWGLSGPELKFYDAELVRPDDQSRVLAAKEVGIGVSLTRLLADRTLVVDNVTVRDTVVELRELKEGDWHIQGRPLKDLTLGDRGEVAGIGSIEVVAEDVVILLIRDSDEKRTVFEVPRLTVKRNDLRVAIDAEIRLPQTMGGPTNLTASQRKESPEAKAPWNVTFESEALNLSELSKLLPERERRFVFGSGYGNVDLSMQVNGSSIESTTAEVDFASVALGEGPAFDVRGRLAFSRDSDGWLVAADDLQMTTPSGPWPRTALRLETSTDDERNIVMLDARASHVNLSDFALLLPWLDDAQQETLTNWSPGGTAKNLIATVSDFDTDSPRFTITADLEKIGISAKDERPGFRGFTATLRADSDGGLLDIHTKNMTLDLGEWQPLPVEIESAEGTVIWRRSNERLTILSDSVAIQSPVLDSQSNIEITIVGDESPVIDLASTWSIDDLKVAKRYIPKKIIHARLHQWFQDALVSGRMPRGSARLYGPIDKFPFDNDEGQLLIEANVRDMTFRYLPQFPAAQVADMDVVLENTRLYTNKNRSVNRGNSVVNAKVEIADLRKPVLEIESRSTGTLESIRDFSINSPISTVFGGQLGRVAVSGDAAFTLDLTVPLLDWRSFEFTSRVSTSNGTLTVDGFDPPLTELAGTVTIERELVSSEGLSGRFLGAPVTIELSNAPSDMPEYRVVASASGSATPQGLVEELGVPLAGKLEGQTEYRASIYFPRAGAETPAPLAIQFATDLRGLAVDLPAPLGKVAGDVRPMSGNLEFLADERIRSRGSADNEFAWQLDFARVDDAWDFDRGMLAFGGESLSVPDVRGLHIRGKTGEVRLDDWLALSRGDAAKSGAAERIRSIDIQIDDLYLLGQHLTDHHVRVDRSARDWLVQFDGDLVKGSVFVPYQFTPETTLVMDMERLVLPGDDEKDADTDVPSDPVDPRKLPSISLRAGEFALGERFFGAIEAEFKRTPTGLTTDNIVAKDASFEILGRGNWAVDATDPMGYRSAISTTLTSTDVVQTMQRLNYQPGIVSDDMNMVLDLSWSGGPRLDFLDTLDGEVTVQFGDGQLDEVDPGAGRMFGLLSIVALPRRLSLDFRDVFQKGFGFDKITGSFRIDDGDAYTCDLSLQGPAADIAIIGRANLAVRDYDQTAVVGPKVGNTLPVAGLVLAGPQAAAALLILSQIFKKPIQDVGQVYYNVSGSWDDPSVESANADQFAVTGQRAGCL